MRRAGGRVFQHPLADLVPMEGAPHTWTGSWGVRFAPTREHIEVERSKPWERGETGLILTQAMCRCSLAPGATVDEDTVRSEAIEKGTTPEAAFPAMAQLTAEVLLAVEELQDHVQLVNLVLGCKEPRIAAAVKALAEAGVEAPDATDKDAALKLAEKLATVQVRCGPSPLCTLSSIHRLPVFEVLQLAHDLPHHKR